MSRFKAFSLCFVLSITSLFFSPYPFPVHAKSAKKVFFKKERELVKQREARIKSLIKQAQSLSKAEDYTSAQTLLEEVLELDPTHRNARKMLEENKKKARLRKRHETVSPMDTARKRNAALEKAEQERRKRMIGEARIFYREGLHEKALALLDSILEQAPKDKKARSLRNKAQKAYDKDRAERSEVIHEFLEEAEPSGTELVPAPQESEEDASGHSSIRQRMQNRISLRFDRTPLISILDFLSVSSDVHMAADASVYEKGYRVTAQLQDLTVEEALDRLLNSHNLVWRLGDGGVWVTDRGRESIAGYKKRSVDDVSQPARRVLIEARFVEADAAQMNPFLGKTESFSEEVRGVPAARGAVREAVDFSLSGILPQNQVEDIFEAFARAGGSRILSHPQVTTPDGRQTIVEATHEFVYPTRFEAERLQFDMNGDGDFEDADEIQWVDVPKTFAMRDVGITLHVTPDIGSDTDALYLTIVPELADAADPSLQGVSGNLVTSVMMTSGDTVVLTSSAKSAQEKVEQKPSLLARVPFIGKWFRAEGKKTGNQDLVVFVTATIIEPPGKLAVARKRLY